MSPLLAVRVHPGARRAGILGRLADGTWKLRVTEVAEAGRANRAVERLLADSLGLSRAQVAVVRGAAARSKVVEVRGLSGPELTRRLEAAAGAMAARHGD